MSDDARFPSYLPQPFDPHTSPGHPDSSQSWTFADGWMQQRELDDGTIVVNARAQHPDGTALRRSK